MSAPEHGIPYLLSHIGELKAQLRRSQRAMYAQRERADMWMRRAEQAGVKTGRAKRMIREQR